MTDLSHLSDDELMAMYQQGMTQRQTGFVSGPSSAPTRIAKQSEYTAANKQLLDDQAAYKRAAPLRQQLDEFEQLNRAQTPHQNPIQSALDPHGTGGLIEQIPWLGEVAARLGGGPRAKMASLSGGMQVGSVPSGQGSVSNFERSLFAAGTPSITQKGPVNQDIISRKRQMIDQEGERLAFRQAYLQRNQHLNNADALWDQYLAANPYGSPQRQPWAAYFGTAAPTKRASGNAALKARSAQTANDPLGLR